MIPKDNPTIRLLDATENPLTAGIFAKLVNPPWSGESVSATILDTEYYYAHSGKKPISPLVHNFLDDDNHITAAGMTALAALVAAKFYEPWTHLMSTYYATYSPLENYRIAEEEEHADDIQKATNSETSYGKTVNTTDSTTYGKTKNVTDELTHGKKVDSTDSEISSLNESSNTNVAYGKVNTVVIDDDKTSANNRYGFNSANAPVPTETASSTDDATNTSTDSGSDVTTYQDSANGTKSRMTSETASGKDSRAIGEMDGGSDTRSVGEMLGGSDSTEGTEAGHIAGSKSIARSGLNGLTSYQRLIAEDRKLWLENFFDQVYRDIDSILTLPIYPSKRRLQSWVLNCGYPNI